MKNYGIAALALAAAGSAPLACAQSGIGIYGILDAGVVAEGGGAAGPVTKVGSGIGSGSRLGFKGSEDLGGGTSAVFLLENGFQADTGAAGQGGLLFGRQAYLGLASKWAGTLTVGRQYTPHYLVSTFVDPYVAGFAGDIKNIVQAVGSGGRMDNSIKYAAPAWNGFSGELAYGLGEMAGNARAGRQVGASIGYAAGPLVLRVAYHNKNNPAGDGAAPVLGNTRNTLWAATWDFIVLKLHLGYGIDRGPFSSPLRNSANPYGYAVAPTAASVTRDSDDVLLGVTAPFGPHTLLASYLGKNDRSGAGQDARLLAVGYRYALSRRTELYTVYGRMRNRNGASYTVGNSIEGGSGDRALDLGVRHTF